MLSTKINKSRAFIAITPVVLVIIAVGVIFFGGAAQLPKQSSLVSPAELHARELFRANWQAIMEQRQAGSTGSQIPVTGISSGRAMAAYSARLEGMAAAQMGMSQRSLSAYSARLSGQAGLKMGMSQRAIDAYAARWEAQGR